MAKQIAQQAKETATPAPEYKVDDLLQEDDIQRFVDLTQQPDAFDLMVEQLKKAGAKVTEVKSSEFLQWRHGVYRVQVKGARFFQWADGSGEVRSCPVLDVVVLDGSTREAKALVGKPAMVSCYYELAKALCESAGFPLTKSASLVLRDAVANEAQRATLLARSAHAILSVECGKDGVPLKRDIKGGHRMMANAKAAVWV